MTKKKNILITCIICSILLLLFDFFKFDMIIRAKGYSFGLTIIVGLLAYLPYLLYVIWTSWLVVYIFKKGEIQKVRTFMPLAVMVVTILLLTVVPYSDTYANLNYSLNKQNFEKTIDMVNNGEIQQYQTNMTEYVVPYRFTSYIGKLYTCVNDDVTKVMFYAYRGFRGSVVLIYSSDGSEIKNRDFEKSFNSIKRIDDNWYSAKYNY